MTRPSDENERYSRQRDIVPGEGLAACRATVIGVGAIGRQVALQLTAMGIPWLQLVDFDVVEVSNVASQGYLEDDLGKPKVEATAELCVQINHELAVHVVPERFRRRTDIGNILFCCVDDIGVRKLIFDATKDDVDVFVDGRMSAEALRVLTVVDQHSREFYQTTLFESTEAYQASCTARSTIFTANIAAGMMLEQLTRWLRHMAIDPDIQFNLLTSELTVFGS